MINFQDEVNRPVAEKPQVAPTQGSRTDPGSSIAALWIQVTQNNQPPASIPSTLPQPEGEAYLQLCPKCSHRLNPPFKATGRQVCAKCNWSDKPRNPLQEGGAIEAVDLRQLLEQASVESLDNMKPRRKPG